MSPSSGMKPVKDSLLTLYSEIIHNYEVNIASALNGDDTEESLIRYGVLH